MQLCQCKRLTFSLLFFNFLSFLGILMILIMDRAEGGLFVFQHSPSVTVVPCFCSGSYSSYFFMSS